MLENQSNEMDTIVETFFIEEVTELIGDGEKLAEWNKYVEELGLQGQTKLVTKEKSPIPFLHMNKNLISVLETLCPTKSDVENFDITPIPLEIMKLISLSTNEMYFHKIQVWADNEQPDPCVIGLLGEWICPTYYAEVPQELKGQKFNSKEEAIANGVTEEMFKKNLCNFQIKNHYLLGKWADVKHSFAELTEMAKQRYIKTKSSEYNKQIKYYQEKLNSVFENAEEKYVAGNWVND